MKGKRVALCDDRHCSEGCGQISLAVIQADNQDPPPRGQGPN
jgi:hypothetical protein